jgi:CheY-like chemotaxis protein
VNVEVRAILLAEDDARDVELTLQALEKHRLANRVVVVKDGVETLDYLRSAGLYATRDPGLPAVLLLDIKMPRKNGIDVLREIRADPGLKSLPVVMLTSSREGPDLRAAYDLGANAYVVKPVRFPEFLAAVGQTAVFWAILNEPLPGAEVADE